MASPTEFSCSVTTRHSAGVACITVASLAMINADNASGSRTVLRSAITTVAPAASGHSNSSAAMSNDTRCHRDDAIARPDPAILEYRVREGCEVARRDHHALGATRRTGGVDHVGEVITRRGRRRKHDTRVGELTVHEDTRGDRQRKLPGAVDTGQDTHRSRVLDHELEPLRRVIDVEWQVRSADAQYREQSGHQIRISIQRDGDYLLGSGADREKFAGQLVDARRQFPVGNSDLAGDHRDVVGVTADVSSEQLRDPRRRRRASARVAIRLVFRQSQIRDDSADFVTEDRDHTVEQCVRSRGVEQPGINRQSKFCCGSDEFEVDALSGRVTDTGSEPGCSSDARVDRRFGRG